MKTKNYTGTSRPCGEYNKLIVGLIERNLNNFNKHKRKGILSVEHYIDDGDKWKILKDNSVIVSDMNLEQLFCGVISITFYQWN